MDFDYKKSDQILTNAHNEGREFLLETEAYDLLSAFGIPGGKKYYLKKGEEITEEILRSFSGEKVVLKVVSPTILHKTDVKGVRFPLKNRDEIKKTIEDIYKTVPANFVRWLRENPSITPEKYIGLPDAKLEKLVRDDIRGILIAEFINYQVGKFGHEVLLGLQDSREFGPVITYGAGGVDTEFYAEIFKERQAVTTYSAEFINKNSLPKMIKIPAVYKKLSGKTREKLKLIEDTAITDIIAGFTEIGKRYSSANKDAEFAIKELEINPLAVVDGGLLAIDALCRFEKICRKDIPSKPLDRIKNLLKPQSIAIIGVSQQMNIGHIILNNIIKNGFSLDKLYVIKDGLDQIEGAKCYPSIASLPEKVDLFIYTLPATMVPDTVREILDGEWAKSVILISGGLGETKGGKKLEQDTLDMIHTRRRAGKPTPVFNGGNCMGLRSIPGKYDTLFIPEYKMDLRPEGGIKNLAYLSQSGAFMICRLSKIKAINPLYAVTTGNQMDLTITDYLETLVNDDEIKVYAVYIEGFADLDGIRFAKAAKKIIESGRYVVLYKAGRTAEGKTATSGHTSSIAGDYSVCKSVLEKIGVILPHNFDEFEDIIKTLSFLYGKKIAGNRIGLVSNAGFECVGMADNLKGNSSALRLAEFSPATSEKIVKALAINKIDKIVEAHNPLDITPMAGDEIYDLSLRAILENEATDLALVSIVPLTWQMQSLPKGLGHNEDIMSKDSIAQRMIRIKNEYNKPFVVVVDSGKEYDPMVEMFEANGIPVFRTADRALRILRKLAFHMVSKSSLW
jgi:acyl-CoA synthetase (NDP forming)